MAVLGPEHEAIEALFLEAHHPASLRTHEAGVLQRLLGAPALDAATRSAKYAGWRDAVRRTLSSRPEGPA